MSCGWNVGGPSECHNIYDSFRIYLVHLSSIKFLTGYYLKSISYHNVISDYKYTEYNIIKETEYNVLVLIES